MEFKWNHFDLASYEDVKPYVEDLLNREVNSDGEFRKWLTDYNYLGRWFYECISRVNIKKDRFNAPENFEAFKQIIELAHVPFQIAENLLEKRKAALAALYDPRITGFEGYLKRLNNSLQIFREENVPLQKLVSDASQNYSKLQSSLKIELDGEIMSHSAAMDILRGSDRDKRERAFRKLLEAEKTIGDEVDKALSEIVSLRHQMAQNAGYNNTLEYLTKSIDRLDYDIASVKQLHGSVKKLFVPLLAKINTFKKAKFGYDVLFPWDLQADLDSFPDETLFTDIDDFYKKCLAILDKIHPEISGYFLDMLNASNFDMEKRLNKSAGGYQARLTYSGIPFIFSNLSHNILHFSIFFHEMGHALHTFLCAPLFFIEVNGYPTEVAELASQALELISAGYYAEFVTGNTGDENKFKMGVTKTAIEAIIRSSLFDEFCHWLYENPQHSVSERRQKWDDLYSEYYPYIDCSSDQNKRSSYRNVMHYFIPNRPLYHIEYGISMIGAANIYFRAKENLPAALEKYFAALRLGYSVSIPEIYKTAGIEFNFSETALTDLAQKLEEQLITLM